MRIFEKQCQLFFKEFGSHKKMVLSSSLENKVTARMISIVAANGIFYFQTDKNSRKYDQLKKNPSISLCMDNVQIEGICKELGHPLDHPVFCSLYQKFFQGSYNTYSSLLNERLFAMEPFFIQKWIYQDTKPFIETFDFNTGLYKFEPYLSF